MVWFGGSEQTSFAPLDQTKCKPWEGAIRAASIEHGDWHWPELSLLHARVQAFCIWQPDGVIGASWHARLRAGAKGWTPCGDVKRVTSRRFCPLPSPGAERDERIVGAGHQCP